MSGPIEKIVLKLNELNSGTSKHADLVLKSPDNTLDIFLK